VLRGTALFPTQGPHTGTQEDFRVSFKENVCKDDIDSFSDLHFRSTQRKGFKINFLEDIIYTVKKGLPFSRPQPGCHKPNSPWPGIIYLFPARESLVSSLTFFYSV
jgi:hypothetical protein